MKAGEIITIRKSNENKVLVNSSKEWLILILPNKNNVNLIKIKKILIIINKNNKQELIKLKYSIILYMIFDPILL